MGEGHGMDPPRPADHLGLLRSIAWRYRDRGLDRDQLISAGYLALHGACLRYDPRRHAEFSTYATRAIRNAMMHAIATENHLFPYARRHGAVVCSLDHDPVGTHPEWGRPSLALERAETAAQVQRALRMIRPRDREVMRLRFGLDPGMGPQTLEQIAWGLGITKERVRQLECRAMRRLEMILSRWGLWP